MSLKLEIAVYFLKTIVMPAVDVEKLLSKVTREI